jgi:hypothetical protein
MVEFKNYRSTNFDLVVPGIGCRKQCNNLRMQVSVVITTLHTKTYIAELDTRRHSVTRTTMIV